MRQLWLSGVLKHPWQILLSTLLLVLLMSTGLSQLYFRGDYRVFFADDNPQLLAFERMQDEFNKSDNILLGVAPKEWTHRYVTFVSPKLTTNLVILVDDGMELHHDTLYHLGVDVGTRAAVIDAHHLAEAAGWTIHKPARTTWRVRTCAT